VDTIAILDSMIADPSSGVDLPAAVIVETVQGEGGLHAASIDWLRRLQALCRKHDILLIVDDIQAGCGRTGTFFSFEPAAITPDIVTLSKSLSGFGIPFSIVLLRRDIDRWSPGEHNGTFRGNNHAFVTAAAALHEFWSTPAFSIEVNRKGEHLRQFLQILVDQYSPHITEVRGRGMMRGIRFADPQFAAGTTRRAFEQGMIIERSGPQDEVVKCLMPLTVSDEQLNEGLYLLACSIAAEFGNFEAATEQRKAG
jgi:diaminobutyrate-2-oxoglutarate transaminase